MTSAPKEGTDIEYAGDSRLGGDRKGAQAHAGIPPDKHRRAKEIAAAVFAACAIALLIRVGCGPARHQRDYTAEAARMMRDATVLGAAIRESGSYEKALLLTRPPRSSGYVQDLVDAAREGLRKGFGGDIQIAATGAPQFTAEVAMRASGKPLDQLPDLEKWLPPIGYWFDGEVLADVADAHSECDLIVSMVGLPRTPGLAPVLEGQAAQGGAFPRLAIVEGPLASPAETRRLFERTTLVAAVVPGTCWASAYPGEADTAYQSDFLASRTLLTLENWGKALQVCPDLLHQPGDLDE